MAAFLGVIKNQYFCRRNLRAAARATDRFTVRGPALLVTSGHLRPRYREISSSGAHRVEISTKLGTSYFLGLARAAPRPADRHRLAVACAGTPRATPTRDRRRTAAY